MTVHPAKPSKNIARDEALLAKRALGYPEVHEDNPWGHRAFKVRKKKVFLFLVADGTGLHVSVKLPQSADAALLLPFARPTEYGLGKSGWVSASFTPKENAPVELLRAWIDESYRAIAPKTLVKQLEGEPAARRKAPAPARKPTRRKPAAAKAARKRSRK